MTKERRLGRGLEALLGRINPADPALEPNTDDATRDHAGGAAAAILPMPSAQGQPLRVNVDQIDRNPFQPRQEFSETELAGLAESLTAHGLLQPVVVRRVGTRYQVVAGERRLRAALHAGWTDVPVHLIEADDRQVAELAIVENVHRKDLNALEKAAGFQRYLEQYGCTQEELAGRLRLDRSTVANLIRLLELPEPVQDTVRHGKITQGHARALLPLGEEQQQIAFCQRIQREGLSVRQTEALIQETIRAADVEPLSVVGGQAEKPHGRQADHLDQLAQQFRSALGMKVTLKHSRGGRGKLEIHFRDHDEFERLREHICGRKKREAG